jgi:hypothetical protein
MFEFVKRSAGRKIRGGDKNVALQARMPALRSARLETIFEGMPNAT